MSRLDTSLCGQRSVSATVPGPAKAGSVYLVGAGPGDPELITLKGLRLVRRAEVLVFDRLVHRSLVGQAPAEAELVDAGKAPGYPGPGQRAIEALLVDRARLGRMVVRLKGGDPFVFGRGGEEAEACARAGIPCQVVPGVSSALAAPAAAGIPVTSRGVSSSLTVITGHRADSQTAAAWRGLAGVETLVVLMGVARLPHLVEALLAHGRDPATPAAAVERATLPDQRVIRASLVRLPEEAALHSLRSPATLIVGPTVALASASVAAGDPQRSRLEA